MAQAQAFTLDRVPGAPWRPLEVAAVLVGFMLFWPLAAAYVGWKIWKTHGRDAKAAFDFAAWRPAAAGNSAFEAYRRETLERLERERQKLRDEEREFAEFLRELHRAKDREEFERFMAARGRTSAA
jgi:hypothetical protein